MELKPCPFCGQTDQIVEHGETDASCDRCSSWDWAGLHDIINWNTRPIEDALNKRIKELEDEILFAKENGFRCGTCKFEDVEGNGLPCFGCISYSGWERKNWGEK